jgi:hypothetical protein
MEISETFLAMYAETKRMLKKKCIKLVIQMLLCLDPVMNIFEMAWGSLNGCNFPVVGVVDGSKP